VLKIRSVAGDIEIRKIDEASLRDLQQREDSNWKAWEQRRAEKERRNQEQESERRRRQQERDADNHEQ